MNSAFCIACAFIIATAAVAQIPNAHIPVRITGDWAICVDPGSVSLNGRQIILDHEVPLTIPPPETAQIRAEEHAALPVYNPQTGGWRRGIRLNHLITQECTAAGTLLADTVTVSLKGTDAELVRGRDWEMDSAWGTIGRIDGGAIPADAPVTIDYDYVPMRLDSIAIDTDGKLKLVTGKPGVGAILPPALQPGEVAIARIWFHGPTQRITDENIYPVCALNFAPVGDGTVAERLLPATLAKLRAGQHVKIVAWGDSVTNGGGVDSQPDLWYQHQFLTRLRDRFPQADIELFTAAWGGASSTQYMTAPVGGPKDFKRDVLDQQADLITAEFVNDAGLSAEQTAAHYATILAQLRSTGAEVIFITPHFTRPDWMRVSNAKFSNDPRPYVAALRTFAAENSVAVADANVLWGQLWKLGIPYLSLEANSINHPDARGHEMFATALMQIFPDK